MMKEVVVVQQYVFICQFTETQDLKDQIIYLGRKSDGWDVEQTESKTEGRTDRQTDRHTDG